MQKAATEEAILQRSPGLRAFKDATGDPHQERQRRAFMEFVAELHDHDLAQIDLLFLPKPPLRNADEIRAEFHDPLTAAKALAQLAEELRASTRPLFVNVVARLLVGCRKSFDRYRWLCPIVGVNRRKPHGPQILG